MVKHLPPGIKQLLALRNPHPRPTPPFSRLDAVLRNTLQDAQARKAEKGWLTLATCTLLTANAPPTVGRLYHVTTRTDPDNASTRGPLATSVEKAALMRESALKSCIFVGVPRTILSLAALNEAIEEDVRDGLRKTSKRTATKESVDEIMTRGRALWGSIYAPHAEKLYNKLGSYHPDFIGVRRGARAAARGAAEQGNLSRALGSVVGAACLRAEGGVGPQLTSHVFGLLKARGAPGLDAEDAWLASDAGAEWVVRTVDAICDVAKPELAAADAGAESTPAKL
ncbi:uncharacterized protein BXZ73DRAFT_97128 [Epithele typhae]|uniref:uncharacterized protein n=1 Tax=Epithele typhae TaxID=378194 RepID=UPI002007FF2B|nr:uncharacterized protein BXZ73DRAFT_97128 [Epithele typhae]KAH9943066.1 hypothetical protein BXZ73DRAFT_97128 [Epithele typhae]